MTSTGVGLIEENDNLEKLLASTPEELARYDIAEMNLLCATGLPGAEDLDIAECLGTLDAWAVRVRQVTARKFHLFDRNRELCLNSESIFRMRILIETLQKEFGVHYNPERALCTDKNIASSLGFFDSGDLLLNGLLGPKRAGTCNNLPVLYVAIGRRLGYAVYLAATPDHVFVRWESPDGKERFNIDGSGSGPNVHPDQYYAEWPRPFTKTVRHSDYYLRAFTPRDDLALFIVSRAWVLQAHGRYAAALPWYIQASVYAPREPMYPLHAARMVGEWLRRIDHERNPAADKLPLRRSEPGLMFDLEHDPRDLLPPEEAVMALTALGRYAEIKGSDGTVLALYAAAHHMHPKQPGLKENLHRVIRNGASHSPDPRPSMTPPLQPIPKCAALKFETLGLRFEREGRLGEAQMVFAEALLIDPDDVACQEYLHRVVRKLVIQREQSGGLPLMPDRFGREKQLTPLVRRQALISAEWGCVLASRGHLEDAALVCSQATRLDPDRPEYELQWIQVSKMFAERYPTPVVAVSSKIKLTQQNHPSTDQSRSDLQPSCRKELVAC